MMEIRTKAVIFFKEGIRTTTKIEQTFNISERTVRRWAKTHQQAEDDGLKPKKTGSKRSPRATVPSLD